MESQNNFNFSEFIAAGYHDIKNMLALVLSSLDNFVSDIKVDSSKTAEFNKLKDTITQINETVMQLLCCYKFEKDQYKVQNITCNVAAFLNRQYDFAYGLCAYKNIDVELDCDPSITFDFDEILLKIAIRNAIMNAISYAKKKIKLNAEIKNNSLNLIIDDDGAGFAQEHLGIITNTKTSINEANNSSGLGLFFAAMVANFYKNNKSTGYVELTNDSSLGGARFKLVLP